MGLYTGTKYATWLRPPSSLRSSFKVTTAIKANKQQGLLHLYVYIVGECVYELSRARQFCKLCARPSKLLTTIRGILTTGLYHGTEADPRFENDIERDGEQSTKRATLMGIADRHHSQRNVFSPRRSLAWLQRFDFQWLPLLRTFGKVYRSA